MTKQPKKKFGAKTLHGTYKYVVEVEAVYGVGIIADPELRNCRITVAEKGTKRGKKDKTRKMG